MAVAGAVPGDAIVIRIKDIEVTSIATASGNDMSPEGSFNGDPYCAPVCPGCGAEYPETRLDGIGREQCAAWSAAPTPRLQVHERLHDRVRPRARRRRDAAQEAAERIAREPARYAALPENSVQNPILAFAPHDIVGLATRLRPFIGPARHDAVATVPDSHNAGDFGASSSVRRTATRSREELQSTADGHMDIDAYGPARSSSAR